MALENFDLHESVGFIELNIMHQSLKVLQLQALFVDEIKISCQNLEDVLLDSIICPTKAVSIYAPNLRAFRSYCYSTFGRMLSVKEGKSIVKTHEILAHCNDFLVFEHQRLSRFALFHIPCHCFGRGESYAIASIKSLSLST